MPVDRQKIKKLEKSLGRDKMLRAINLFCMEAEQRITSICDCGKQELEALNRHAHSLKSSAATFGARELSVLAEKVEELAHDSDAATRHCPELKASLARTLAEFRRLEIIPDA